MSNPKEIMPAIISPTKLTNYSHNAIDKKTQYFLPASFGILNVKSLCAKKFEFQIEETFHRKRVDEFLFNKFASLSKMYLRDVIKAEKCEVNGYTANSGVRSKNKRFCRNRG